MKQFKRVSLRYVKPVALVLAVVAIIAGVYLFHLTTLTKGISQQELDIISPVVNRQLNILDVLRTAAWMPYNLILFGLQYVVSESNATWIIRALSVLFGLIAVGCFYRLVSWSHSRRVAIMGTVGFVFSAWLLMIGRLATPTILYVSPLFMLGAWAWVMRGNRKAGMMALALLTPLMLYIPGLCWLVIGTIIFQRKAIGRQFRSLPPGYMFSLLGVIVALIVPLCVAIAWPSGDVRFSTVLLSIGGLPSTWPAISAIPGAILEVITNLFLVGKDDPMLFIGGAPLVSFFVAVTSVAGIVDAILHPNSDRSRVILVWFGIGIILAALGGVNLSYLLPVVFISSVSGIRYILSEWLQVFPRNPVARGAGIAVIATLVALSVAYQMIAYFIAWPHTDGAKETFIHTL